MQNYNCKMCKFFEPSSTCDITGLCKRHAPRPKIYAAKTYKKLHKHEVYETRWPWVVDLYWCGEFEAT